ncbi:CmpA/NrtA family ABC transporter substrate-binding protein [Phenylobacterium sp.]|uniref:CmpA/NrtA family ABC transporter substrate-binding protein n=1 Tax=Phenylobacterium sp. TaxID=1871053 RepID=UPI00286AC2F5|nr:CmpA/NrtA family ABC transporter substrate-binding protein [Phenylobacterium sp.]
MAAGLTLGFLPLNDAAPLIVARDKGFFAAEGLDVTLRREASWATLRDKVAVGALDGAQLLAPLVLATSLGVGGEQTPMTAPMALNRNGAAVTLSRRLGEVAAGDAAGLARLIARRREEGASQLTFAVVFPYSIHNYLLRDWMAEAGIHPDRDVRLTVAPPARMTELLADGVIEGFCAGEPWNAAAVAWGAGKVAARSSSLAPDALDKVFAVTRAWGERRPEELAALLRTLMQAAAWAEAPENRVELASLLARRDNLDVAPDLISRGLTDLVFHGETTNVPTAPRVSALVESMARWGHVPSRDAALATGAEVFREDLLTAAG